MVVNKIFNIKNLKTAIYVFIGLAVFLFCLSYGISWYAQWKGEQKVKNLAEMLKKIEAEDYKLAMADTYGGKTPRETLDMFIAAVEKGDYELASRYFVVDNQHKELQKLYEVKAKNNIDFLLNYLIKSKNSEGILSSNKDRFTIKDPIFIEFVLYPNGVWKITEI